MGSPLFGIRWYSMGPLQGEKTMAEKRYFISAEIFVAMGIPVVSMHPG